MTGPCRAWRSWVKTKQAANFFAPVYDRFTEGFDTADFKEARALLEELE